MKHLLLLITLLFTLSLTAQRYPDEFPVDTSLTDDEAFYTQEKIAGQRVARKIMAPTIKEYVLNGLNIEGDSLFMVSDSSALASIVSPSQNDIALNTAKDTFFIRDGASWVAVAVGGVGGGGVSDGDKGDITISGSGTTYTVDNGVIDYDKLTQSLKDSINKAETFLINQTGIAASIGSINASNPYRSVDNSGGTWSAANSTTDSTCQDAYVIGYVDADNAIAAYSGTIKRTHNLDNGYHFLQQNGTESGTPDTLWHSQTASVINDSIINLYPPKPFFSPGADASSNVDSLFDGQDVSKIRFFNAILIPDTNEVTNTIDWSILTDSGHVPTYVDSVYANVSGELVLVFSETVDKILTYQATPDERTASKGLFLGASVGLSDLRISIYSNRYPARQILTHNGTSWAASGFIFANNSVSTTTTTLTLISAENVTSPNYTSASIQAIYAGTNNRYIRQVYSGLGSYDTKYELIDPTTGTAQAPASGDRLILWNPIRTQFINANSGNENSATFDAFAQGFDNIWVSGILLIN